MNKRNLDYIVEACDNVVDKFFVDHAQTPSKETNSEARVCAKTIDKRREDPNSPYAYRSNRRDYPRYIF
ncbi:MAG: hypothetical protein V1778_05285 [bacterium]